MKSYPIHRLNNQPYIKKSITAGTDEEIGREVNINKLEFDLD